MGSEDSRNFRSHYYDKMGFKSVDEKKSIDIIVKEKPIDKMRLIHFCLRFSLPSVQRVFVWKILLDIIPVHEDSHEFASECRTNLYLDIARMLEKMGVFTSTTSVPRKMTLVKLVEKDHLWLDLDTQLQQDHVVQFETICSVLYDKINSEIDCYWFARNLGLEKLTKSYMEKLVNDTEFLLQKEDPILHSHLVHNKIFQKLPLNTWFSCLMSSVFHHEVLMQLWDKIIAGAWKILSFSAAAILIASREELLMSPGSAQITKDFQLSEEQEKLILKRCLDLWQMHGSPCVVRCNNS